MSLLKSSSCLLVSTGLHCKMPWAAHCLAEMGPHRLGVRASQEEGFSEDSQWEESEWQTFQKLKEEFQMRHRLQFQGGHLTPSRGSETPPCT